jgi:hypothetical protein
LLAWQVTSEHFFETVVKLGNKARVLTQTVATALRSMAAKLKSHSPAEISTPSIPAPDGDHGKQTLRTGTRSRIESDGSSH